MKGTNFDGLEIMMPYFPILKEQDQNPFRTPVTSC